MTNSAADSSAPPAWRKFLAYTAVTLMPLSLDYERIAGRVKENHFYLSPLDALMPILALLMLVDLLQHKPWSRFKTPALAPLLWSGLALLSCAWIAGFSNGTKAGDWAKAAANPLFVVAISSWVFSNLSNDPAEYRKLALCLLASFGFCALVAVYQYMGPVGVPFNPAEPDKPLGGVTNLRLGGWYENRMQFGAQAAMLLPAAAAFAALDRNPLVRILCAILAAAVFCVTMAAGGFLGAAAGVLAISAMCILAQKYLPGLALLAGVLAMVALVLPNLPAKRDNAGTLGRNLALFADSEGKKKPTARLARYQAALDFLASHKDPMNDKSPPNWLSGAGAGQYNDKVNQFYDDQAYPKPGGRTDAEAKFDMGQHERDSFALLEKTGVELGVTGLAVLAFFFAAWIFSAAQAFARSSALGDMQIGGEPLTVLALAALGAGVGALVVSVFAYPVQRGAGSGGTLAFFFALSVWLRR